MGPTCLQLSPAQGPHIFNRNRDLGTRGPSQLQTPLTRKGPWWRAALVAGPPLAPLLAPVLLHAAFPDCHEELQCLLQGLPTAAVAACFHPAWAGSHNSMMPKTLDKVYFKKNLNVFIDLFYVHGMKCACMHGVHVAIRGQLWESVLATT